MLSEHKNTHRITSACMQRGDYVLAHIDGRAMVGVSLAPGGWKPARTAWVSDLHYFGANYSSLRSKGQTK